MSGIGAAMAGGNSRHGRVEGDFYPTPPEVTRALLKAHPGIASMRVWEPCAGDGAMSKLIEATGAQVEQTDINPRSEEIGQADFLTCDLPPGCNAIITNPPFNLASAMIERALDFVDVRFVAMVLKSTYWHAKGRQPLFRRFLPTFIHPLTWRPDFLQLGRPTMEVMWCVWAKDNKSRLPFYQPLSNPT